VALWIVALCPRAHAGQVEVLAASSLTDVLSELGRRYAEETGLPAPVLAFSASSTLVHQIEHGAPADVVMTADAQWMDLLQERGDIDAASRADLARNELVVVVARGAMVELRGPAGLADAAVRSIAVAGAAVPAGARAREAIAHFGLEAAVTDKFVVSRNVRGALMLADRGEVDAAIVYRTDAWASERVEVAFAFPPEAHGPIVYPFALTTRGASSPDARGFVEFLRGPIAAAALRDAGFSPPGVERAATPKAAWRHDVPSAHEVSDPLRLSLWVAAMSLLLSLIPAVALGWLLARREFIGKSLLSTFLLAPLVLPPVVIGFLLLELFGRGGPLSPVLSALGIEVAFTQIGAVVAAAVVGFPLLVLMSRLAIEAVDVRYERLAETLGLAPWRAFVRVTLPMALPGLAAGCVLAYARALGEFGATAVLAADTPGHTRTLALAIFALYEQPGLETQAHRLVWISIGLCAVALVGYEWLGRVQKRRLSA
jgi:molybdate transport system permease protein